MIHKKGPTHRTFFLPSTFFYISTMSKGKCNKCSRGLDVCKCLKQCDWACAPFRQFRFCRSWVIAAIIFFVPIFWGLLALCFCNPQLFDYSSPQYTASYTAAAGAASGAGAAGFAASKVTVDYSGSYGNGLYKLMNRPWWAPSTWCWFLVWVVIYLLIGAASTLVFLKWQCFCKKCDIKWARQAGFALIGFYIQLFFNIFWIVSLFCLGALVGGAILGTLATIISIIVLILFFRIHRLAFWLYVPFVIWQTFVLVLNAELAARNL